MREIAEEIENLENEQQIISQEHEEYVSTRNLA